MITLSTIRGERPQARRLLFGALRKVSIKKREMLENRKGVNSHANLTKFIDIQHLGRGQLITEETNMTRLQKVSHCEEKIGYLCLNEDLASENDNEY